MKEIISKITKNYLFNLIKDGKRIDGRALLEQRELNIEPGYIGTAEGSARVKLGDTEVIVGVKMKHGDPFPDTPGKGVVITTAELIPMASPEYESGPPGKDATELARVVDRGIREADVIDVEELCIEEGEKVWMAFIDIHVLDFDGNLFDAAGIGAMTALMDATVPASNFEDLGDDYPLPVDDIVVPTTFAKIKDKILLDPSLEEEKIADARLTIARNKENNLVAMQKGLSGTFQFEDTKECLKHSKDLGTDLRDMVTSQFDEDKI